MRRDIDPIDARLLDLLQQGIPIARLPFDEIGSRLGVSPGDAISRTDRLKSDGIIRQISAIFDSAALGYQSALVAFKVEASRLDEVAETVSANAGVSHCYSRDAEYNLWFTITVPPGVVLESEVGKLAGSDAVRSRLVLRALNVFKIGVFLPMGEQCSPSVCRTPVSNHEPLPPSYRSAVRVLQRDMPLAERPFAELARDADMTEDELIEQARELLQRGTMRRFAAVLRHQRAGYRANAMVCWRVEADRVEEIGTRLATDPAVSHCYERSTHPDWPYTLYTMVHARTDEELSEVIGRLAEAAGADHLVLRTVEEYKKSRVTYYAD